MPTTLPNSMNFPNKKNLLSEKMDRWVYLEELAAKISKASY